MSIGKHVELVSDKVFAHVDFGTGMHDDSLPEAKNACVCAHWLELATEVGSWVYFYLIH